MEQISVMITWAPDLKQGNVDLVFTDIQAFFTDPSPLSRPDWPTHGAVALGNVPAHLVDGLMRHVDRVALSHERDHGLTSLQMFRLEDSGWHIVYRFGEAAG